MKTKLRADEAKRQSDINRAYERFREMSIGQIFNKPVDGIAVMFQKLVRMRAADEGGMACCFITGKKCHYRYLDGAHYIGRGNKSTIVHELNVHPVCREAHQADDHRVRYRQALVDSYGPDAVEALETLGHTVVNWDKEELAEMYVEYKREIQSHTERIQVL